MREFLAQSGKVVSLAQSAKETISPIQIYINGEFLKYRYKRAFFLFAEDNNFEDIDKLTLIEVVNDVEYILFSVCSLTNDAYDMCVSGYENAPHKIYSLEQILDGLIDPKSDIHKLFSSTLIWLGGNLMQSSPNILLTKHIVVEAKTGTKDLWQPCAKAKAHCAAAQTLTDTACQTIRNSRRFAEEIKTISGFGEVMHAYHARDDISYLETLEAAIVSYAPNTKIIHATPCAVWLGSDDTIEVAYGFKPI